MSAIIAFCFPLAVAAQDHEIRLARSAEVGERYSIVSNAKAEQHMTRMTEGHETPLRREAMSAHLTAVAEVLGTIKDGRETKTIVTVTKLTRTDGAKTTDVVHPGTVVLAERVDDTIEFTIDGTPVSPRIGPVLALVLDLGKGGMAENETIIGATSRKRVGDAWPIDSVAAAGLFSASRGWTLQAENITGSTTLIDFGKDGLKIFATIAMSEVGMPVRLPPGARITESTVTTTLLGIFPMDNKKRPTRSEMTFESKFSYVEMEGDKEVLTVNGIKITKDATFATF